jgi:hypothetical protein
MKIQQNCHYSQTSSIKRQPARKKIRVYYYLLGPIDLTKMFSAAAGSLLWGGSEFINRKVLSGAAASASFGTFRCAQQQHEQQAESEHPLWQHHVRMKHRWAAIKKDVGTVNFLQFFFSLVCTKRVLARR